MLGEIIVVAALPHTLHSPGQCLAWQFSGICDLGSCLAFVQHSKTQLFSHCIDASQYGVNTVPADLKG